MNLPETVQQPLMGETALNLSDALGEPPERIERGIRSGVPLLLAALSRKASRESEANMLMELTRQQHPSLLDNLTESVRQGQTDRWVEQGRAALSSLLGTTGFSAVTAAVTQHSRMTHVGAESLVGFMGPVIFATLARHSGASTGKQLNQYLSAQAADITHALSNAEGLEASEAAPVREYDQGVASTASDLGMHDEPQIRRQEMVPVEHGPDAAVDRNATYAWAGPVLAILVVGLAVAWIVWPRHTDTARPVAQQSSSPAVALSPHATSPQVLSQQQPQNTEPAAQPAGGQMAADPGAPGTPNLSMADAINLLSTGNISRSLGDAANTPAGQGLARAFEQLTGALASIHDGVTADGAVPQLQAVSKMLDTSAEQVQTLSPQQQERVRSTMGKAANDLGTVWQKISASSGSQHAAGQPIQEIRQKLTKMSGGK